MSKAWRYKEVEQLIQGWELAPSPPAISSTWMGLKNGCTPHELAWDHWPLDEDSIVFEIGGHNGRFAQEMIQRYQPIIYFFEPSPRAFEFAKQRFLDYPKIKMYNFGLGNKSGTFAFGDDTKYGGSFLSGGEPVIQAKMIDIAGFIVGCDITHIDFMQINIEGGEYFLLPHMINTGILNIVQRLMLHWHPSTETIVYQSKISAKMLETHEITRLWTFQCWERRQDE